ncbi:hypothetical protein NM688_g2468 [Phlebia brevispora]|uniref:Uncharacterized protein n=1 Tax=Phlebia brevispora TaxID=194682 RepID=A0ACC1T8Q9_9APHY|nr:hypothetical protein NM688_g2468 [Phlebia brevispora]
MPSCTNRRFRGCYTPYTADSRGREERESGSTKESRLRKLQEELRDALLKPSEGHNFRGIPSTGSKTARARIIYHELKEISNREERREAEKERAFLEELNRLHRRRFAKPEKHEDNGEHGKDKESDPPSTGYARKPPRAEPPRELDVIEIHQAYDAKWEHLKRSQQHHTLDFHQIPWPVYSNSVYAPEQVDTVAVKTFFAHPLRREDKSLKAELLRWHPDKFKSLTLPQVRKDKQMAVLETANRVLDCLLSLRGDNRSKK